MPFSNKMAQLGHACIEAGNLFQQADETSNIVVLSVKDEPALLQAVDKIREAGIKIHCFYEPDYPQGWTAACSEPVSFDKKIHFKKYKLIK